VGGDRGRTQRVSNGRIGTLTSAGGLPCDTAQWVIEDDLQSLWLGLACGLVRVERAKSTRGRPIRITESGRGCSTAPTDS
jgi:hypothetical protein